MMKSCRVLQTIFLYSPVNRPPRNTQHFSNLNPTESQFKQFFQHLTRNVKTWSSRSFLFLFFPLFLRQKIFQQQFLGWQVKFAMWWFCSKRPKFPPNVWDLTWLYIYFSLNWSISLIGSFIDWFKLPFGELFSLIFSISLFLFLWFSSSYKLERSTLQVR